MVKKPGKKKKGLAVAKRKTAVKSPNGSVPISERSVDVIGLQRQFERIDRDIKSHLEDDDIPRSLKGERMGEDEGRFYLADRPELLKKKK